MDHQKEKPETTGSPCTKDINSAKTKREMLLATPPPRMRSSSSTKKGEVLVTPPPPAAKSTPKVPTKPKCRQKRKRGSHGCAISLPLELDRIPEHQVVRTRISTSHTLVRTVSTATLRLSDISASRVQGLALENDKSHDPNSKLKANVLQLPTRSKSLSDSLKEGKPEGTGAKRARSSSDGDVHYVELQPSQNVPCFCTSGHTQSGKQSEHTPTETDEDRSTMSQPLSQEGSGGDLCDESDHESSGEIIIVGPGWRINKDEKAYA